MSKIKPYLLIAPAALLLLFIMGVGICTCILQSLGYFPLIGLDNITFDYYKEILSNQQFINSLMLSLKTSIISSTIATIIGILLAYLMTKSRFSKLRYFLLNLPIIVPHIIVVMLAFAVFSKTGIISRMLYNLNLINDSREFVSLVNDKAGIGIIIVYIYKGMPFIAITVYNILKSLDVKLEDVALNLGANKFQVLKLVIMPQIMPTILSSFIVIFAFSFGSFEVPYLIGATNPKALPVNAYINYINTDLAQRPLSMAMNSILTGISFILLILYNLIFTKLKKNKL
ncbi:ABC transporter permease [Paraclostridium bifermentans]|uniref:ABC transporter permease subunit n=1 Tax=Paraclostridium bifermentans TaxID=1490 RepID=A0A5P3XC49_PARBF|nr:ABC transporter permease subunit [Paraclostridium bifermentans]EQK47029.1 binding--dependent transport system inner membrane component family protein [[Clostridium] bifermentans ATCC 19299] [Paraclostridium bifermentans ATCC 19299]MCE9676933.1 ABC transporter permease subunit [Paraclostridium bifermentans]MCR1874617.1 ABC transporter permease subunit [Paraclostridium bifermentans]QEZ67920.1 ABC transporter permease subunit [Paraclostridium bifermentans]TQO57631.1 ABC transporter permease su